MEWISLEFGEQILFSFTDKWHFLSAVKPDAKISSLYFVNIKHSWSRIFQILYCDIVQSLKPTSRSSMNFSTKPGPSLAFLIQRLAVLQKNFFFF